MSIGFNYNSFQDTQTIGGGRILIAKPAFHRHVLHVAEPITKCKSKSLIQ